MPASTITEDDKKDVKPLINLKIHRQPALNKKGPKIPSSSSATLRMQLVESKKMSFSTPNPTPNPTQTQTPTPNPTPAGQEEDKKPNDKSAEGHINLKVKGQNGIEVLFRIKRNTQLRKLMGAYCERQSVDQNAVVFLFNGRRLGAEQTPYEVDMEDGDEIDAMLHQAGGGFHSLIAVETL